MEKSELRKTMDNLWNDYAFPGDRKFARNCLRKDRDELQKIYDEDPAALLFLYGIEVRQALEASEISPALPMPESDAISKMQTSGKLKNQWHRPLAALTSFFINNRKPAISVTAILMLLGGFFIYRSFTIRQETAPDSATETTIAEGLKKTRIYGKDNYRETAANSDVGIDTESAVVHGKKSGAFRNAIVSNLVAGGSNVIHYRMDSGAEMIFITGLD